MVIHKSHTMKKCSGREFCSECGSRHSALVHPCPASKNTPRVVDGVDGMKMLSMQLDSMKSSPLLNYAGLPGLGSWLINNGLVRMFDCERNTREFLTPHSHKYDFTCLVIEGKVTNTLFWCDGDTEGDTEWFVPGKLTGPAYGPGNIWERGEAPQPYHVCQRTYGPGSVYSMAHSEIHSIAFEAGTRVLFLEGPQRQPSVTVLEPWAYGRVVPTFRVDFDWMYLRPDSLRGDPT